MDIVYIRDLKIKTVVGVYDWERAIKQAVCIDLEMAADIAKAARSDNISDALNYKSVAERVVQYVENSQFLLIETMAEKVATLVREEFSVPWLRLRIGKPAAIPGSQEVGVIIERGEQP